MDIEVIAGVGFLRDERLHRIGAVVFVRKIGARCQAQVDAARHDPYQDVGGLFAHGSWFECLESKGSGHRIAGLTAPVFKTMGGKCSIWSRLPDRCRRTCLSDLRSLERSRCVHRGLLFARGIPSIGRSCAGLLVLERGGFTTAQGDVETVGANVHRDGVFHV